jgi:hypothetical protein
VSTHLFVIDRIATADHALHLFQPHLQGRNLTNQQ